MPTAWLKPPRPTTLLTRFLRATCARHRNRPRARYQRQGLGGPRAHRQSASFRDDIFALYF